MKSASLWSDNRINESIFLSITEESVLTMFSDSWADKCPSIKTNKAIILINWIFPDMSTVSSFKIAVISQRHKKNDATNQKM